MKRGRRNFWRAWHQERHRLWRERYGEGCEGQPMPPPELMEAWRKFFRRFTGEWPEEHWAFHGRRFRPWHQGVDTFNPFVANLLSQGGGLLPLLVLHLLEAQPRYGNEIMSLIGERTRGQWVANPGAIYPLMSELEDRGLVESRWEDPRKRTIRLYRLTARGRKQLSRVKSIVRPKLEEAIQVLQELVQDLESDAGDDHADG